jgi:hypothetical protein
MKGVVMDLESLLNRVGKRVFIEYYEKFDSASALTNAEIAALLPPDFTLKSRLSRTTKARRIFREGLQVEALRVIATSDKTERAAVAKAVRLLAKL